MITGLLYSVAYPARLGEILLQMDGVGRIDRST